MTWNGTTRDNVVWTAGDLGVGHASPIIWDNRVFLVSARPETEERLLVCLDLATGRSEWQQTVLRSPLESKHALNSYASATPVTDGQLVYVAFLVVSGQQIPALNVSTPRMITSGEIVVAAYDFTGHRQWLVKAGNFASAHGFCSSPILYEDMVIVNGDHDGDSYIVALDKHSGACRWRQPREYGTRSYVTPLIRDIGGRVQMVFSGSRHIVSMNPRDGSRYWKIDGPTEQFVASMVCDGRQFFMTCGYPDFYVMAIKPDGFGDVTHSHVAWQSTSAKSYVPSPVVIDGLLLVADDRGTANCFDAATGERYWQARLGSGFRASLSHAGGLVYFIDNDGMTRIVRPGRQLQIVAENLLGEPVSASPAFADQRLLIRGESTLYCIENSDHES